MTAGKGQFVRGLKGKVGVIGSGKGHRLPEVVVEVVVELVLPVLTATSEDVYVVAAAFRGLDDAVGAQLVAVRFGFEKINLGKSGSPVPAQASHLKRMLRHHHGVVGNAINANGVMCGKTGVVFVVVSTAVEMLAYTGIRTEYEALAIQFHRDAVGVLVVA